MTFLMSRVRSLNMEEKLWTQSQVAEFLKVPEEEIKKMIEEGKIHAYKIGGVFIRFQKKEIEMLNDELKPNDKKKSLPDFLNTKGNEYEYTLGEKLKDFIYFNDFYIISIIIILGLLIYIFVTIY